jgi:hypothetical protein
MKENLTSRKSGWGKYAVTSNGKTYDVKYRFDGELAGLWEVLVGGLRVGVEATKRDAIRMIEDGAY